MRFDDEQMIMQNYNEDYQKSKACDFLLAMICKIYKPAHKGVITLKQPRGQYFICYFLLEL